MIERVVVGALMLGLPLGCILYVLVSWRLHRLKMNRLEKYQRWVKTLERRPPAELRGARAHILRVLKEGPQGSYHGPWELMP
jgi:hypothetical protein